MLVSRVLPAVSNNGNIVPTRVNTKRTGANPSFGYLPSKRAQKLLSFLPLRIRKEIYEPLLLDASSKHPEYSQEGKKATDAVWALMLKVAWKIRTKLHKDAPLQRTRIGSIAKSIVIIPDGKEVVAYSLAA